jgi:hypothetical protein
LGLYVHANHVEPGAVIPDSASAGAAEQIEEFGAFHGFSFGK